MRAGTSSKASRPRVVHTTVEKVIDEPLQGVPAACAWAPIRDFFLPSPPSGVVVELHCVANCPSARGLPQVSSICRCVSLSSSSLPAIPRASNPVRAMYKTVRQPLLSCCLGLERLLWRRSRHHLCWLKAAFLCHWRCPSFLPPLVPLPHAQGR